MDVCSAVTDALSQYSADGVAFEVIYSEGDSILETLGEILNTLITGVILTMAVLFLFFGDLKASLIVGISMPLSILLAVILLSFAGYSIDIMTGTSLIIAIGMIVDNSIVILESCMRAKEDGGSFRDAAVTGTSSMLMSILGGTLTTVVVYIPLGVLEGPVDIVELDLAELHVLAVGLQKALHHVVAAVGGKAQVADAALGLLLQQIVQNAVLRVQVGVDVHFADVVKQVEVEIIHSALLQLLFKYLLYLGHIGQVIAWKLGGQIKALPGVFLQRPANGQL